MFIITPLDAVFVYNETDLLYINNNWLLLTCDIFLPKFIKCHNGWLSQYNRHPLHIYNLLNERKGEKQHSPTRK